MAYLLNFPLIKAFVSIPFTFNIYLLFDFNLLSLFNFFSSLLFLKNESFDLILYILLNLFFLMLLKVLLL